MTRIVRPSTQKATVPLRARTAGATRPTEPAPSLRPYARGVASGMLFMGLLGCLPETPKTSFEPAMQPRDVRVQFPSQALARDDERADTDASGESAARDDMAPRPATMEDLSSWMASSAQDAPRRLEEMNRQARETNAELARRAEAKRSETPKPTPTPKEVESPRIPEAKAEPVVLARPAPRVEPPPAVPERRVESPIEQPLEREPPTPLAPSPASVLAAAMGEAFATHAKSSAISRPVAQAVADAISAIGEPDRPFRIGDYPGLDEDETLFVTRLHEASAEVGRDLAAGKPLGEAVAKLADAIKAVEPAPPLLVRRSEFATRVDGFGQLQPITNRRFLPGRQNQIILYNELDGFTSERNEKGEWTTNLATRLQILAKHDGTEVWSRNWLAVTDSSTVRRGDFFVCEKVVLSEYLTVGTYILKTSVRDERTGAIAERSVEFSMVADPALAAR